MSLRPNKTARIFLAVLLPLALLAGLVLHRFPQLTQGGFPAYSWALLMAFVVEAALRPRIDRHALPPLSMAWRVIGVVVATLITLGSRYVLDMDGMIGLL